MGERRWRASQLAGLETIPAIVRETADDDLLRDALLENLHRAQLNPLEEAAAYQQMLDDFDCTHEELAQRIGRSRPQISNTLRLLQTLPGRAAPGRRRRPQCRTRARLGRRSRIRPVKTSWPVGSWPKASRYAASRRLVAVGEQQRRAGAEAARAGGPRPHRHRRAAHRPVRDALRVDLGRSKGKITVEFASLDDLQRILQLMDPR